MTTTIVHSDAHELASLFASDRGSRRFGHFGPVEPGRPDSAPAELVADATDIAKSIIYELTVLQSDDRWDYLAARGYSEADLDRLSDMMMTWLGPASHAELRELAEKDSDASPTLLLAEWLDAGRVEALDNLAASYEFPSPILAVCYAIVDTFVTARVALRMADIRRKRALRPPIDWSPASPEEREEDLLLAEAGYDAEVALWPEY